MNEDLAFLCDRDTEEMVLGSIIDGGAMCSKVSHMLSEDCFYIENNRKIFSAIKSVYNNGEAPTSINIANALNKSGVRITPYDLAMYSIKANIVNAPYGAARLKELGYRRKMHEIGIRLIKVGTDVTMPIDDCRNRAVEYINSLYSDMSKIRTLYDAYSNLNDVIKENMAGTFKRGCMTGFSDLDKYGGFRNGSLIMLSAMQGTGKTAFAMNIAINAARNGKKIAMYNLEMEDWELAAREVASNTGVSANKMIATGYLNRDDLTRIDLAMNNDYAKNVYFDTDSMSSIDTIIDSIITMKQNVGIDGVFIDFIQLLPTNSKGNESYSSALTSMTRRLKVIAREHKIFICCLSQLNRERCDGAPDINMLYGSGMMAANSDIVLLLYRPEAQGHSSYPKPFEDVDIHGTAMVDVAKGRNMPNIRFIVGFDGEYTRFRDLNGFLPYNTGSKEDEDEKDDITRQSKFDAPF